MSDLGWSEPLGVVLPLDLFHALSLGCGLKLLSLEEVLVFADTGCTFTAAVLVDLAGGSQYIDSRGIHSLVDVMASSSSSNVGMTLPAVLNPSLSMSSNIKATLLSFSKFLRFSWNANVSLQ